MVSQYFWNCRRHCFLALLPVAIAMATSFASAASGAEPVKIIVPVSPGSSLDLMARMLADQIGRAQGLTMIVENRPGASTAIGTETVARAAPDGQTLLAAGTGFVINPLLRKTSYDPLLSFEPICHLSPICLRQHAVGLANCRSPALVQDRRPISHSKNSNAKPGST
jgi:tripartite-type tricarboxylate transporter receptor subunit TctC